MNNHYMDGVINALREKLYNLKNVNTDMINSAIYLNEIDGDDFVNSRKKNIKQQIRWFKR